MTIFLYTHTEEFCNKDILYFNKIKIPLPDKKHKFKYTYR